MADRTAIFIPVIIHTGAIPSENESSGSTSESNLIEVYAESSRFGKDRSAVDDETAAMQRTWSSFENKAVDKCWDPIAAPLRFSSPTLYKAGCTAVNAVRKLRLKRPIFSIYQLFRPRAAIETQRLLSLTAWGPTEGRSAELGLALALVTRICAVHHRVIVATGALSSATPSSESIPLFRSNDVKIHPVTKIREKLEALACDIKNGAFQEIADGKELLVFTPKYYQHPDGNLEIDKFEQVAKLRALGVRVIPVNWLSEATHVLRAYRTQYLFQDRLFQFLVGALVTVCVAFVSWTTWRNTEIPMRFTPASLHALQPEPFELCTLGKKQYVLPFRTKSLIPSVPVTATIGWKTIIGDPTSVDAILAKVFGFKGYYIAVIVVSEFSPISLDNVRMEQTTVPMQVRPGDSYQGWIKLNDQTEINALIILAQRHAPFEADRLREQFYQRFPQPHATQSSEIRLNIDAATDFISKWAPGALIYPFSTVMEKSKCFYQEKSLLSPDILSLPRR